MVCVFLECVAQPVKSAVGLTHDRYDIKTSGFSGGPAGVLQVMLGGGAQPALFAAVHGLGRRAEVGACAVAHLDEHQAVAVLHYQVDLAPGAAVVTREHGKAILPQVVAGSVLGLAATALVRRRGLRPLASGGGEAGLGGGGGGTGPAGSSVSWLVTPLKRPPPSTPMRCRYGRIA